MFTVMHIVVWTSVLSWTGTPVLMTMCGCCSAKGRVLSWCDRILWHVHSDAYCGVDLGVELDRYTSVDGYVDSDHKPVVAVCSLLASPLTSDQLIIVKSLH